MRDGTGGFEFGGARRRGALLLLAFAATLGGVAACGDSGSEPPPVTKPAADLRIVRRSAASPPLVANTASFWAVKGEKRELRMFYQRANGSGGNGAEFLRLRIDRNTLARRPDGSTIATGDSVLITVTADPNLLSVDFQPTGLRFSAIAPAELKLRWAEGDDDLNDDKKVDDTDDSIRRQLAIWTHEALDDPWLKLATALQLDVEEAEAKLSGFSGFAVAY